MQKNTSRLVNAAAFSALYLLFLAWYDGWGMTALTQREVDQYIANIREDSELRDLRDNLSTHGDGFAQSVVTSTAGAGFPGTVRDDRSHLSHAP